MAWTYLAESEESVSRSENGSDLSLTVRSSDTLKEFYSHGWKAASSRSLRFGTTSERFQETNSKDKSISFSADFPVRILVARELARVWRESEADYFSRSCGLLMRLDRDSCSWKTLQQSLFAGLKPLPLKLPREGFIVDGLLYPLRRLEQITGGIDGGSWPTPKARDSRGMGKSDVDRNTPGLETQARWRTPSASDWKNRGTIQYRTPTASTGGICKEPKIKGRQIMLQTQVGGKLNPPWVEWLMGYRSGWTELSPLVIQWFRSKRRRRLKN